MAPQYHAIFRKGVRTKSGEREIVALVPFASSADERAVLRAVARALHTRPERLVAFVQLGWPLETMNPDLDYRTGVNFPDWPVEGFQEGRSPIDNIFPKVKPLACGCPPDLPECPKCEKRARKAGRA